MPSVFAHALVPIIVSRAVKERVVSLPLVVAGATAAVVPDADVLSLWVGIPYDHELGHRGASHSLAAAVVAGLIAAMFAPALKSSPKAAFLFVGLSYASHGLLDMLSNGGRGVALFWPFDITRIFAPVTPLQVSPIGARFFSEKGLTALQSELIWIVLPVGALVAAIRLSRSGN